MVVLDLEKKYEKLYKTKLPNDGSDIIVAKRHDTIYYNCTTGTCGKTKEEVMREGKNSVVLSEASTLEVGYFVEYHKRLDVVVLKMAQFDTSRLKKGEIRSWEPICNYGYNLCYVFEKDGTCYVPYDDNRVKHRISHGTAIDAYGNCCMFDSDFIDTHSKLHLILKQFFGHMILGDKGYISISHPMFLSALLSVKPSSIYKKQQEVQDIIDISLKNISDVDLRNMFYFLSKSVKFDENSNKKYSMYYFKLFGSGFRMRHFAVIQKVKEGVSVIRIFTMGLDVTKVALDKMEKFENVDNAFVFEEARIYVTDKNHFVCRNVFGKWVVRKNAVSLQNFSFILLSDDEGSIENCKLKYLNDSIKRCYNETKNLYYNCIKNSDVDEVLWDWGAVCRSKELCTSLESPLFESIIKTGLDVYSVELGFVNDLPLSAYIRYCFGDIDKKQKSIIKAIGLPFFMLEAVNDAYKKQNVFEFAFKSMICSSLRLLKEIFKSNPEYLQKMNKETFLKMYEKFLEILKYCGYKYYDDDDIVDCIGTLVKINGAQNILSYLDEFIKVKDMPLINGRITSYSSVYMDYVRMYSLMGDEFNHIPYKIKNQNDLIEKHDFIFDLYSLKLDDERYSTYTNKFEVLKKKWESLAYSNNKFSVIYPNTYMDIIREGATLSHCVKTYIDKVACERTTILFIRKNNDLDTPFFTLEIRNDEVRQCHGFANCNTDTVEGLDEFLREYCVNKKIKYDEGSKVLAV